MIQTIIGVGSGRTGPNLARTEPFAVHTGLRG